MPHLAAEITGQQLKHNLNQINCKIIHMQLGIKETCSKAIFRILGNCLKGDSGLSLGLDFVRVWKKFGFKTG